MALVPLEFQLHSVYNIIHKRHVIICDVLEQQSQELRDLSVRSILHSETVLGHGRKPIKILLNGKEGIDAGLAK